MKLATLDILEQILFGSGAYLGFMLLVVLAFILFALHKYTAVITSVLFILIGLKYHDIYIVDSGSTMLYFWVFSWLMPFFLIFAMLKRKG